MSATIAALLMGTAAVGGFGLYAGSSSSTTIPTKEEALKEVAKVVEQEEEPSQPTPESKPITPPPTPIAEPVPEPVSEAAPEAVPTTETKEEEKVAEPVAETTNMEGGSKQDGGFGKPTWAPLNSGISLQSAMGLTKDQIGSTGSSLIAKWTGAKTAESIQLKLKEIDDQLRVLRAEEFTTKSKLDRNIAEMKLDPDNIEAGPPADSTNALRGRYMKAYNAYLTNKTLFDYNSKLISRIVDEKKDEDTEQKSLRDLFKERFPNKATDFDDDTKKTELLEFVKSKNDLPDNLKVKKTKKGQDPTPENWWNSLNNKTSGRTDTDPSKLPKYLSDREKSYTDYSAAEERMNLYKDKFEELDASIKELTPKLKNIQKKIKELLDTRELVLVELSNYELPKGMFESFIKQKPIQKSALLPTGEQRDRIIAQIKDLEQRIKEKKEDIQDFLSTSLESNGTLNDDNRKSYNKKMGIEGNEVNIADFDDDALSKLTERRDKLILELEGRSIQQKEQLRKEIVAIGTWKDMIRQLKLTPEKEKKYLNPKLVALFTSLESMLSESEDSLEQNIEKYYNTFAKGYKSHIQTSGYTTLIKSLYELNQDLQGNCQFNKGDEVYGITDEAQRLYAKGIITKLIFNDLGGEKACTSARASVNETGKLGVGNNWETRIDQIAKNPPEEVVVEIQQLNIVPGSKTDTKYVQYKREAIPKLVELSTKLDRIQTDLIAKSDKSKKDKTIELKLVFDTAQTFFNDGKLPNNNYGLLNFYATQKEKFNELIKKLTWANTKSVLEQILSPLGLGMLFILGCIFEGGKIVGTAIGKFLIQIGELIKNGGTAIYNSFKQDGFFGSRLIAIGNYFIECGKFLSRKTGELLFAIDDLLPKKEKDRSDIQTLSKRWERAFEIAGENIVSALNFTSETLQSVLPTTKYITNDDGTLKMKDDGTGPETENIDENNYEERRAELCRRIGRGLNTAYDTTGKVITDIKTVLGQGATAIYAAGISIIGIPQIIIDKLKELLPTKQVNEETGEFTDADINAGDENQTFQERIRVLKIRISKGKATSSEILAGSLLCPVGTFGAYMSILLNKLNEAIAYISTSVGIKNVFLGILYETGRVAKENIGSQLQIMKKTFKEEELTADDKATLNNIGIKSINDINQQLWQNLTYTRDFAEIGDFASKSDPISDIAYSVKYARLTILQLLTNLGQASLNIFKEAKRLFGLGFNNVVEFGNQVIISMGQGLGFLWSIATNSVYYGGKIIGFGIVGIIGTVAAIISNAFGVLAYCFIKIVEKGLYTLKTSLIILAAILNPATQIGKYPFKVVIWIFKLGFHVLTLGLVRKYYKDLAKKLADANLDPPIRNAEFEGDNILPPPPPQAPPEAPAAQQPQQVVGPNNVPVEHMDGGSRKNHLTRKQQWTRSKPSRFKTHRIY